MLYTKKGDGGSSGLWGSGKRLSKDNPIFEALGSLDELNSYLGICKSNAKKFTHTIYKNKNLFETLEEIQQNLFILQAEIAGTDKKISASTLNNTEILIDSLEKILPPITTFYLSGGGILSTHLDFTRTLARTAERRMVSIRNEVTISKTSFAYINRLSSLLYTLTRFVNYKEDTTEISPNY